MTTFADKPFVAMEACNDVGGGGAVLRRSTAEIDDGSSRSSSADGSSYHQHRASSFSGTEITGVSDKKRESSVSYCSEEMDLEAGVTDPKLHLAKAERHCRICHLSFDASNQESGGFPMELGCSCKDDLAAAHKQCAEAWFKIKGNKTCEVCGSTAHNVASVNEVELIEEWNEANDAVAATGAAPMPPTETRSFWRGHRFLNFLLACMVFAFVISWLFHFNIPS